MKQHLFTFLIWVDRSFDDIAEQFNHRLALLQNDGGIAGRLNTHGMNRVQFAMAARTNSFY